MSVILRLADEDWRRWPCACHVAPALWMLSIITTDGQLCFVSIQLPAAPDAEATRRLFDQAFLSLDEAMRNDGLQEYRATPEPGA